MKKMIRFDILKFQMFSPTKKSDAGDVPGGAVIKNPPAKTGNMGSSPGPGRSHMPWSN